MRGYKFVDGYLFPEDDIVCNRDALRNYRDVDQAVAHCHGRAVAVQAGGNCGVWPDYLAGLFETVYTFEPDARNFAALAYNTAKRDNLFRFQAGLGARASQSGIRCDLANNCGAYQLVGAGRIPVVRLDDFALPALDLLCLDIEGMEIDAMKGAANTIARFKPVIHIEDNGRSQKYGYERGEAERWLATVKNYRVVARTNLDVILTCD